MNRHVLRFVLILAVGIGAGLVHGFANGMKMPPKADQPIPKAPKVVATPVSGGDTPTQENPTGSAPTPAATPTVAATEALPEELVDLKAHFDAGAAFFADARKREDYVAGHIPGAVYAPFEDFIDAVPDWFNALDLSQMIVVYCDGGDCHASEAVASKMKELGMENVFVFHLGYPAWKAAGFPETVGEEP